VSIMSDVKTRVAGAAENLCRWMVILCACWLCQSARADVLTNYTIVNVTPTSFSVIWRATNATPSIAVYAAAGGLTNLAGQVGVEAFPVRTGNPDLAAGYQRRINSAQLRVETLGFGLMMMRVSDCHPDTTYYFRLISTPTNGTPDVNPVSGPLPNVTTAVENTFVANDQAIILNVPDPGSEGEIVLLTHTNAAYPLAAVVGDGVGTNQVFFNVNDLLAAGSTGNFTPLGDQYFGMDILGPNNADLSQTYTLTFTADFATAMTALVSVDTDFVALNVGSAVLRAGQSGTLPIVGEANKNVASIDLKLQVPAGRLTNIVLQSFAPQLDPVATTITGQDGSAWHLHFAALSGQTIPAGTNALVDLSFIAVSNQPSAFVPLQATEVDGTKPDASPIIHTFAQSGRVVVIANQPLLEAGFSPNSSRQLTLYGKAWTSYAIESSTNLANPNNWKQVRYFAQTNMVTTLNGLGAPGSAAFYRALEFTPDPPVLDGLPDNSGTRTLLSYGRPGSQYTLLAKTNLSNVVPWTPASTYTLTNSFQYLTPSGSNAVIFYRLQRN
jgi:hypothetical protein